jgi:hypothetical protein
LPQVSEKIASCQSVRSSPSSQHRIPGLRWLDCRHRRSLPGHIRHRRSG